jgi:hypothetical protein
MFVQIIQPIIWVQTLIFVWIVQLPNTIGPNQSALFCTESSSKEKMIERRRLNRTSHLPDPIKPLTYTFQFDPPPLVAGEDGEAYDHLLARVLGSVTCPEGGGTDEIDCPNDIVGEHAGRCFSADLAALECYSIVALKRERFKEVRPGKEDGIGSFKGIGEGMTT